MGQGRIAFLVGEMVAGLVLARKVGGHSGGIVVSWLTRQMSGFGLTYRQLLLRSAWLAPNSTW
jgi:hypothetical protein